MIPIVGKESESKHHNTILRNQSHTKSLESHRIKNLAIFKKLKMDRPKRVRAPIKKPRNKKIQHPNKEVVNNQPHHSSLINLD